jgi:hypothetical protein
MTVLRKGKPSAPTGATDEAPRRDPKLLLTKLSARCVLGNMNYTLVDVVRMSRAKRRSVQLWADAGIIRAESLTERRGTGTHRRFGRNEVIIASIINVFSRRQVAIGELQRLAKSIRKFMKAGKNRMLLEESINGNRRFLVITWSRPHKRVTWNLFPELDAPDVDVTDLDHLEKTLGTKMGEEFAISVLIPLRRCLAGLRS